MLRRRIQLGLVGVRRLVSWQRPVTGLIFKFSRERSLELRGRGFGKEHVGGTSFSDRHDGPTTGSTGVSLSWLGNWCHSCRWVGLLWFRVGDAAGHRSGRLAECTVLARSSFGAKTACILSMKVAQFGTAGDGPSAFGARTPMDLTVTRKSHSLVL